jgi:hypothetical protein
MARHGLANANKASVCKALLEVGITTEMDGCAETARCRGGKESGMT